MADDNLEPAFEQRVPPGDDHSRSVCARCGFVDYQNPKIVAGSVVSYKDEILLCRRAIEPRVGRWTLPAGYMELNETVEEAARREAWEEARAAIEIERVLAIYSVQRISQVQIIFRASLPERKFAAGPESQAVELFQWDDIPWSDIAFPTVGWALRQWRESLSRSDFAPYGNPVDGL